MRSNFEEDVKCVHFGSIYAEIALLGNTHGARHNVPKIGDSIAVITTP